MYNIYFNDGVNAASILKTTDTFDAAKDYVEKYINEHVKVDEEHPCSEDVFSSAKTALLQVYDGEPISMEKGEAILKEPVYESATFYTD